MTKLGIIGHQIQGVLTELGLIRFKIPAGNYIVTINDDNGCSNTFDFTVTQPDSYWTELGSHPAFCRLFDYQSGNGVVFGAVWCT